MPDFVIHCKTTQQLKLRNSERSKLKQWQDNEGKGWGGKKENEIFLTFMEDGRLKWINKVDILKYDKWCNSHSL